MNNYINSSEILFELKKKETEVSELLRSKKKYEVEFEVLREKYIEKEYRLKRTEEELSNLKEKLKQMYAACGGQEKLNLPAEILKCKEENKNLRSLLRNSKIEYEEKIDELNKKYELEIMQNQRKYNELVDSLSQKGQTNEEFLEKNIELSGKLTTTIDMIEKLKQENRSLKEGVKKYSDENSRLSVELDIQIKKKTPPDLIRTKSELDIIHKQAQDIYTGLKGFKENHDITPMIMSVKLDPEDDLPKTIFAIKSIMSKIKHLMIESHTEMCSDEMCNPQ